MKKMNKWLIEKELKKREKESKLLMTKKKLRHHRSQTINGKSNKPYYKVKK